MVNATSLVDDDCSEFLESLIEDDGSELSDLYTAQIANEPIEKQKPQTLTIDNRTVDEFDIYTKVELPIDDRLQLRKDRLLKPQGASFYQQRVNKNAALLPKTKNTVRWSAGGVTTFLDSQRRNNRFLLKYSAAAQGRMQSAKVLFADQISESKSHPFLEGVRSFKVLNLN